MKKIIFVFGLFLLSFCFSANNFALAEEETIYYAKVQSTGVQLCSTPSETSALFEIPNTYFVQVEYVVDDYYKVSYNNVEGYVKKDKVTLMNGTPQRPFANSTFKLFMPYGLYESPYDYSTKVTDVDESLVLTYYGTKTGQLVSSQNNVWVYASVEKDGETFYGYVFSRIIDIIPTITNNEESFEVVDEGILNNTTTEFSNLSTGTKVLLIVSISVPSLLILYFLIKPTRVLQNQKKQKRPQKEVKKIRHGDYFEFDESQL